MQLSIFSGVLPNTLIQEENLHFVPISVPQPNRLHTENSLRIAQLTTISYKEKPLSTINIPKPQQSLTVNRPFGSRLGKVSIQKFTFTKGADKTDLAQKILRRNMNQIRYCYQRILIRNPSLKGNVSVIVTVGQNGKVQNALVGQDTVQNKSVSSCVASRFKRMRFSDDLADSQFQVWFQFSP